MLHPASDSPERPAEPVSGAVSVALLSLACALDQQGFERRAAALLTELASGLGCARVTLGVLEKGVIRVRATSHGATPQHGGELFRDIADAMEEAIDQQRDVRVPAREDDTTVIRRAALRLHGRLSGCVQSVPVQVDGEAVGALCFEWDAASSATPIGADSVVHIVDLVGPVLYLMDRDARPASAHLRDITARAWRDLRSERGRWPRRALILLALALLAGLAIPVPHSVSARAQLEGSVERAVVAPIDGYIDRVHVRPGDRVAAGQAVIDLAAHDLELEARRLETEQAQHENAYMAALARSERGDMVVSLSRAEEARTRLALVHSTLARMKLTAGIDGIVIDGDVARLEGAPVARGDVLLTLAPAEGYRVALEVDERDIARLKPGMPGTLLLGAMPERTLPIEVTRITPMAGVIDGRNVYRVEARLLEGESVLRPGLRGMARLRGESAPWITTLWHKTGAWLRMAWWRWGG